MDAKTWQNIIVHFPKAHILQTWQWGEIKSQYGWEPIYKFWGAQDNPEAAALILQRSISIAGTFSGLRVLYVPKGPLLRDWGDHQLVNQVLGDLKELAQEKKAIFIKIDPDIQLGTGHPGTDEAQDKKIGIDLSEYLKKHGWIYSVEQIQFRNTVWVDLTPSADEILARMKQKTRYNVRLAGRKGVDIRVGTEADIDLLYRMYVETSLRDGFVIRDESYYKVLWQSFMKPASMVSESFNTPICEPIIAEMDGLAIAAVVIFRFAGIAYYMHGMSKPIHRNKMPNHLLQWEAMIRSKEAGCEFYDLWGAPEVFDESDPMWGVYRFKQGLGGEVIRTIGAYDLPIQKVFYRLYTSILPQVLHLMRFFGFKKTQQLLEETS
jgi:lipid II:glycine glycyltransferase (peptidoglycan interpeptide bridge formation enzyme)